LAGARLAANLPLLYALQTHWSMALMGEKGSGMFNHQDTIRTASWQAQVRPLWV
jgi:uncharacterized protein Usg